MEEKANLSNEQNAIIEKKVSSEYIKKLEESKKDFLAFKEKFKSIFILMLIVLLMFNIISGFVVWIVADHNIKKDNYKIFNSFLESLEAGLKADIADQVLKIYSRQRKIPDGFISVAQYAYEEGRPSIVEIISESASGSGPKAAGIVLNKEGYILTVAHAVTFQKTTQYPEPDTEGDYRPYENIYCKLHNVSGARSATAIYWNALELDLAIIKLDQPPSNLKPITFADTDLVSIGEEIAILGNPLGVGISVSPGIVSNHFHYLPNKPEQEIELFQLSAILLKGNSGGAVFDFYGEAIGMISFELSEEGSIGYINFAVSAKELIKFIENANQEEGLNISYTQNINN